MYQLYSIPIFIQFDAQVPKSTLKSHLCKVTGRVTTKQATK